MSIFVLQTISGNEEKILTELVRREFSAYVPRRELLIRRGGGWNRTVSVMFPGYIFLECDNVRSIFRKIKNIDGVIRWLGRPTPISSGEEDFVRFLFNGGDPIGISEAVITWYGVFGITGGWLLGKEKYITGYSVRKKRAYLELDFGEQKKHTSVGLYFK